MTDRIVLLSLIPFDRWAPAEEIAAQLGAGVHQIQREIADLIADGATVDTRAGCYLRYQERDRPEVTQAVPLPLPKRRAEQKAERERRASEPSAFGHLLDVARIAAGLSQNMLARYASIDPAYVNRMVKYGATPRRDVAIKLADACHLDPAATDRLLYAAGLAPVMDYQALYEEAVRRLEAIDRVMTGYLSWQDADHAERRVG